jgi:thioredoxin-related protein
VLGAFAWSYFAAQPSPLPQVGLQKGKEFAVVPGVNYGDSPQTLLVAINTHCVYCEGSLPFYKQLIEANRRAGNTTRIIAIFPNPEDEARQYVQQNQLGLDTLASVDLMSLNVAATPTMILVDSHGKVLDFWVGKLSEESELQVVRAVSKEANM